MYFRGKNPDFTPPLRLKGSEFRRKVWDILLAIPYGETMNYGEIARKLVEETVGDISAVDDGATTTRKKVGAKQHVCAQAVGGAVSHNPISLIVPCHRVVGADGSMTGYAGGIDKKVKLLELEQSAGSRQKYRSNGSNGQKRVKQKQA